MRGIVARTRVMLVVPTMRAGGAERVVLNLLRAIDRSRFLPELCLLRSDGEFLQLVPADVPVHDLHRKGRLSFPLLVVRFHRILRSRRPEATVAFMWTANIVAILASLLPGTVSKVLVSEHVATSAMFETNRDRLGGIKRRAIRRLYPLADGVVAVSAGVRDDLVAYAGLRPKSIAVVHDPCNLAEIRALARELPAHPWFQDAEVPVILGVGRLTEQKDFGTLIRAFASLRAFITARLVILGSGPERDHLVQLSRELGVADDVNLLGHVENPFQYMARSFVLVASSVYEGFGLVLVEGMSVGIPVVSTDCPTGPAEVVEHGESGLLAPVGDPVALAAQLRRVFEDEDVRARLISRGLARAEDFDVRRIARQIEECISTAVRRRDRVKPHT